MSIHIPNHAPEIPPGALDAFHGALREFKLPDQTPDTIDLHSVHQMFHLGLAHIRDDAGISAARPAGWRVFAGDKSKVRGDVHGSPSGWKLVAVFHKDPDPKRPDLVEHHVTEFEELGNLPELKDRICSPRLLKIPGLNLEAFWLVAKDAKGDLVVPLREPGAPGSKEPLRALNRKLAERVYTLTEFLKVIRPLAENRMRYPHPYGS